MTNLRQPTAAEIILDNTLTEIELGIELLDARVLEAAEYAAQLVKDWVERDA